MLKQTIKRALSVAGYSCLYPRRNAYTINQKNVVRDRVNLEWVDNSNLGDTLSPLIVKWMLDKRGIDIDKPVSSTRHLIAVGSMIGVGKFDATVWGSGAHRFGNAYDVYRLRYVRKYDVRCVRGPLTRQILTSCGYECPEVYGDPGVLMPLIYAPSAHRRAGVCYIPHYYDIGNYRDQERGVRIVNMKTDDYRAVIDLIAGSERVVSSSLHGIILAEAYGVPAVFLNSGGYVETALMKYLDWYYSTGRYSVVVTGSLEEAIRVKPMDTPDLKAMQEAVMKAFPYDLWENRRG